MKFTFSLQNVLDVEKQLEQMVELQLARATSELEGAKQVLQSLHDELAERQNDLSGMNQSVNSVQTWNAFVGRMNQSIENQQLEIQKCQQTVKEIDRQKSKHRQRIEGLETLRANEETEFQKHLAQKDHKTLLEAILQNQNRR